jgi:hypothetical protein
MKSRRPVNSTVMRFPGYSQAMRVLLIMTFCLLTACQPARAQDPVKFDVYGDLPRREEHRRLDVVATQLKLQPTWVVYFDIYAGKRSCLGEAHARGIRTKQYLVARHHIADDRIIWRDGGYREQLTVDVWVEQRGVQAMPLMPTLKPVEAQVIRCNKLSKRANTRRA